MMIIEDISWTTISELRRKIQESIAIAQDNAVLLLYFYHSQFSDWQKRLIECCDSDTSLEAFNIIFSYIRNINDFDCNQLFDIVQTHGELNFGVFSSY